MTDASPAPAPSDPRRVLGGRIVGIDLARTLALLGMITAHIYAIYRDDHQETVAFQLVAGRSAALFAVLAGVAVALVTAPGRSDTSTQRTALAIRALWVVLIGATLGSFPTGLAIILVNYGLLFLLALPFIRLRARWLALLALGWGLLTPVLSQWWRGHLEPPTYAVPSLESIATPWQTLTELTVTGYYPVLTWGTYLFAGMAVGRLNLRSLRTAGVVLTGGGALALAALGISRWVTSIPEVRASLIDSGSEIWWGSTTDWEAMTEVIRAGFYGVTPTGSWWWLGVWTPHSGSIIDLAHTVGTALLVIGLCVGLVQLTGRSAGVRRAWQILAGAGAMTLTLYCLHALTLALPEGTPLKDSWAAHVCGALLIGAVFAALRLRGPLESLVSTTSSAAARSLRSR